jgi:polynucleotide 5'-triphosphatase
VTHDEKTGQQKPGAKIIKSRVASLDLYNPRFPLDCRISINLEIPYEGDVESLPAGSVRHKDRLSYTQSHYQIDLTQVTHKPAVRSLTSTVEISKLILLQPEKEHELEIEVSAAAVRDQGKRAEHNEPNRYIELVEGLLNNVRVLTRSLGEYDTR